MKEKKPKFWLHLIGIMVIAAVLAYFMDNMEKADLIGRYLTAFAFIIFSYCFGVFVTEKHE